MAIRRIPIEETFPWQRPVLSVLSAPPAEPTKGDRHIVGETATGAWEGHENDIAWYDGAAWQFDTPGTGWRLHDIDSEADVIYNGAAWLYQVTPAEFEALETAVGTKVIGVNTGKITVSATEPLNPEIGDLWVQIPAE